MEKRLGFPRIFLVFLRTGGFGGPWFCFVVCLVFFGKESGFVCCCFTGTTPGKNAAIKNMVLPGK